MDFRVHHYTLIIRVLTVLKNREFLIILLRIFVITILILGISVFTVLILRIRVFTVLILTVGLACSQFLYLL